MLACGTKADLPNDRDRGLADVRVMRIGRRILNTSRIAADNAAAMIKSNTDRRRGGCGKRIMGRLLTPVGLATLACLTVGAGASTAQPAASDAAMHSLPGLSDRATSGSIRCPDGSTRPFSGEAPNDLIVSMACDVPADVAAARAAQADAAVEAKNTDTEQRAALAGQSGVVAGLEATAKTGRPDFLLAQPWVWLVGAMLAIFGLGAFFGVFRKRP